MNYAELIQELRSLFPTPPIYERQRVGDVHEWILQRGIEAGRQEVIHYLETLWGLIEPQLEDQPYVLPTQNRCSADEYGRSTAPSGTEPGADIA